MEKIEFQNKYGINIEELKTLSKLFIELIGDTLEFMNETKDDLTIYTQKLILKLITYFGKYWGKSVIGLVKFVKKKKIEASRKKDEIRSCIMYEILSYQNDMRESKIIDYAQHYNCD